MKTLICLFCLLALPVFAVNPEPAVVPAVQEWTGGTGMVSMAGAPLVVLPEADDALLPVAKLFQEDLVALGLPGPEIRRSPAQGGQAFLFRIGELPPLPAGAVSNEAHVIEIDEHEVRVRANSAAGAYYASRTLLQLLAQSDPTAPALPRGSILDYPRYRQRMLMLDVGRKPFPLPVLQDWLRVLGWFKMNELHLHLSDEAFGGGYTGFRVQCDTFPGLASKDLHYTKAELRALQDFAHARGITVTPEIDMPGHARVFTDFWPDLLMTNQSRSYMDVTNTNTIDRMRRLLDEVIPIFDAPDVHIGTDEYRVGGSTEERTRLHEGFRQFINTMNAHVRSRGKNTRIWSGFEHMLGATAIDPSVIIDMWETDDAKGQIARGHRVINSNHGRTYIVPGCHYYGVSNPGIYNGWEPWMVSGDKSKNPEPADPHLLGGKLHVWNDQGPTGYTHTEIAWLTRPSLQVFAEKLWGRKGSADHAAFLPRAALVANVPGTTLFDRRTAGPEGVVLELAREITLGATNATVALPADTGGRQNLEWPWTLTLQVKRTADFEHRGVLLSSDLAEVCANYAREEEQKTKGPDGKEVKTKITRRGIGFVRAAGAPGATPAESYLTRDVSGIYADPLPLDRWVTLTFVGTERRTKLYVDGQPAGEHGDQMVCPLTRLGGFNLSFPGSIRNLKVVNRALSPREVARAAGLDAPDSLSTGAVATASASDDAHGFLPALASDGQPDTRWSSGPTGAEQWLQLDLGARKAFSAVRVNWEVAFPKRYAVSVSDDGHAWREVGQGEGREGITDVRFPRCEARCVRITCREPATGWGYSVWEAEVLP
jgi:hexosaminidase